MGVDIGLTSRMAGRAAGGQAVRGGAGSRCGPCTRAVLEVLEAERAPAHSRGCGRGRSGPCAELDTGAPHFGF